MTSSETTRIGATVMVLMITPVIIGEFIDSISVYSFSITTFFAYALLLHMRSDGTEELQLKMEESAARLTIFIFIALSGLAGSAFLILGELSENDTTFLFGFLLFGFFAILSFSYFVSFLLVKRYYSEEGNKEKISLILSVSLIIFVSYAIFTIFWS